MGHYMVTSLSFDIDPIISIFITGPDGKFVHKFTKKSLGRFYFETQRPGEYKLVFSNLQFKHEKSVVFSIHNQEEKESNLMINEVNFGQDEEMKGYISEISRDLNNLRKNSD